MANSNGNGNGWLNKILLGAMLTAGVIAWQRNDTEHDKILEQVHRVDDKLDDVLNRLPPLPPL